MAITLGNTTITGLGAGGLPSSSVTTDTLATSAVTRPKIGFAGTILQVQQYVLNSSTTGYSWYGDVGLDVTITPTSTSSKILVVTKSISAK